jgi:hypothetical protein
MCTKGLDEKPERTRLLRRPRRRWEENFKMHHEIRFTCLRDNLGPINGF